jgi:hypothetical protein
MVVCKPLELTPASKDGLRNYTLAKEWTPESHGCKASTSEDFTPGAVVGIGVVAFDLVDRDVEHFRGVYRRGVRRTDCDSELTENCPPLGLLFIPGSDAFDLGLQLFAIFYKPSHGIRS